MGRLGTACTAFWQILTDPQRAAAWQHLGADAGAGTTAPPAQAPPATVPTAAPAKPAATPADAVYALVLLQREGRLVDFLQEDIDAYDDAQVGAAVRQIHAGCRRVLAEHFGIEPLQPGPEGERVEVPAGFDPARLRLTGRVTGQPPYAGALRHRGWRAAKVRLPERNAKLDPTVICPAEVEL